MLRQLPWFLVLCACAPSTSGTTSSSGQPAPYTLREYLRDYYVAQCDLEERCVDTRGRRFSSRAGCEQAIDDADAIQAAYFGVGLLDAYVQNHTLIDESAARACITGVRELACDAPLSSITGCDQAVEVTDPLPVGALCDGDIANPTICDPDEAWCEDRGTHPECLVCAPLLADGAGCSANAECRSGFCNGNLRCAAPAFTAAGGSCTRDEECLASLVCIGSECAPRRLEGQSCDAPGETELHGPCVEDLVCVPGTGVGGTCQPRLPDGSPCAREGSVPGCAHFCVFETVDAPMGTCQSLTTVPDVGSPCAAIQETAAGLCRNADDVYAAFTFLYVDDQPVLTACECRNTVGAGEDCLYNGACGGGRCVGAVRMGDSLAPGTCQPKLIVGEQCRRNSDCLSDVCTPNPAGGFGACEAAPACP